MFSVKEVTRPDSSRSSLGSVPVGTTFLFQGSESPYIRVASVYYVREREGMVAVVCLDNGFLYNMPASRQVYLIDIEGSVTFIDKWSEC